MARSRRPTTALALALSILGIFPTFLEDFLPLAPLPHQLANAETPVLLRLPDQYDRDLRVASY